MAKTHLTDAAVERYRRPQTGRTEVSDTEPGLFLWVTANGTKSWVVIYRMPGAEGKRTDRRKMVIGRHPAMGVAAARDAARKVMALAAEGIDPEAKAAEDKAHGEREAAERQAGSFAAVAAQYVSAMLAGKLVGGRKRPVAQNTAKGREALLNNWVLPKIGNYPLPEVTPKVVAHALAEIEDADGPVDEALSLIRRVFKFAMSRGLFHGTLPTTGMTNRQARKQEARALTDDELRAVWQAAGEQGWPFGSVIRLLMLTGQRRSEIAELRWEEVDWDRQLLVLPAERVKNRAGAHEVPLTEPALQILREAQAACEALGNDSGLVFPSETGKTPISGWNKLKAKLDRDVRGKIAALTEQERRAVRAGGALRPETRARKVEALAKIAAAPGLSAWRIHDLRHTFITRSRDGEENGEGEITWSVPLDVLQAAVNHEITAGVTGRYDHGDIQRRYRLRKRELMDWWAGKLMLIVGEAAPSDNVVQLPVSGRA